MARQKTHIPLKAFLNGRLVGDLKKSSTGGIDFQYDKSWLAWEHAMPISLSLPLREDRYVGKPVIAVFDNLLPENTVIRRRLAERVKAGDDDAYSLLAAVGRDCIGALQFVPEGVEPKPSGKVEGQPISDKEIALILKNLGRAPLGVTEDDEFRISIAGVQEKTALLRWKDKWYIPHRMTATTHIFKPQIGKLENGIDLSQSVENEHFCMTFMAALGMPVAKTTIQDFGEKRVLIVERFDRQWATDGRLLRRPQEDCCQALSVPPTMKYEPDGGPGIRQILELLKGSDDPANDQKMFLKAQLSFWLLGATDGHAKNFSVFLNPGGRFHLTPLYDIMSTQPNVDAGQINRNKMKLAMAVGDNRHYVIDKILPRHFIQTAVLSNLPAEKVTGVIEELEHEVLLALDKTKDQMPADFPEAISSSINTGIKSRLQLFQIP
ncbi:MAG: type II toxin-antitoxin system HipA family toxin [Nitrospirae bacterium]|nr:type II toxin-antitoxin system HipA family toxin [Nitrospirota bacterium]MBI3351951.1 type II toxin-antitoxin system HipA family toxin [Nitrospirota bacterium]